MSKDTIHELYFKCAMKEAEKAKLKNEVPVGCVVVKNGKIISRGHNVREKTQKILSHAELIAIEKAAKRLKSWRLEGCSVYITLEPCPMCAAALWQARVKHVYYGAKDLKTGAVSLNLNLHQNEKLNHKYSLEFLQIEHCAHILTDFFKQIRKNKKKAS